MGTPSRMPLKALFHSSGCSSRKSIELADEFLRGVAEFAGRRRIDQLDHACGVERQDRVRSAADNGIVARVLALAQDAFAAGDDGDIDDLQQASEVRSVADRPDGDVVEELPPRVGPQREDRRMQRMGDQSRSTQFERLRYRRGQPGRNVAGKQFVETPAVGVGARNAARGFHPDVPADDPSIDIEQDEPDIDRVEDDAVVPLLRRGHSRAPSLLPCAR